MTKKLILLLMCILLTGCIYSVSGPIVQKGPPEIGGFYATPEVIAPGENTTLNWGTGNATSVSIDNGVGNVYTSGGICAWPEKTTVYTLTAVNEDGSVSMTVKVTVTPSP